MRVGRFAFAALLAVLVLAIVCLGTYEYLWIAETLKASAATGDFWDERSLPSAVFSPRRVNVSDVIFVIPTERARERYIELAARTFLAPALGAGANVFRFYVTSPDSRLARFPQALASGRPNDHVWVLHWPDNAPGPESVPRAIRLLRGEQRMAMALLLAHQAAAQMGLAYKFMLYGDDDTFWAVDHVLDSFARVLPDRVPVFAPMIPGYFQTARGLVGESAETNWLTSWLSLACLFDAGGAPALAALGSDVRPRVLDARARSECLHPAQRRHGVFRQCSLPLMDWCERDACVRVRSAMTGGGYWGCEPEWNGAKSRQFPAWDWSPHVEFGAGLTLWFHGGFGAVFSRGLLDALDALDNNAYRRCVLDHPWLKGDNLIAQCVQSLLHVLPSVPADVVAELTSAAENARENASVRPTVPALELSLAVRFERSCVFRGGRALSCHVKSPGVNGTIDWDNYPKAIRAVSSDRAVAGDLVG